MAKDLVFPVFTREYKDEIYLIVIFIISTLLFIYEAKNLNFLLVLILFVLWTLFFRFILMHVPIWPQKEPELIFSDGGIEIYHVGFLPWKEIKKLSITWSRRHKFTFHDLIIELHNPLQSKHFKKRFNISGIYKHNPHIVITDLRYLKTTDQELQSIYQKIATQVNQLKNINTDNLYKPIHS